MATRAVYKVEIDDSDFKAFKKLFDKYEGQAKSLPKTWDELKKRVEETKNGLSGVAASAKDVGGAAEKAAASSKNVSSVARSTALAWSAASREAGKISSAIGKASGHLLKWEKMAGALAGVLGVGSLFGIDRLANAVASQRREALSQGVSYGANQAFSANYGTLLGGNSLISNIAGAKFDATSPAYTALVSMGIDPKTIGKKDAAALAAEVLEKLPPLFANTPKNLIGARAQYLGIDQLMPREELIALLSASPEERAARALKAAQDAKTFALSQETQKKWLDLTMQLSRSGMTLETVFAENLAKLEPGLEKISEALTGAVKSFGDSDVLKRWMDALGAGLDKFANYLASGRLIQDVENFASEIEGIAKSIWSFVTGLADLFGVSTAEAAETSPGMSSRQAEATSGRPSAPHTATPLASSSSPSTSSAASGVQAEHEAFIRSKAAELGIDPNVAVYVAGHEGLSKVSAKNPNTAGDENSSFGDFQLHFGGVSKTFPHAGMGDDAARQGIDARNAASWQAADTYALQEAAKNGWRAWSGASGLHNDFAGIGRKPRVVINSNTGSHPAISSFMLTNNTQLGAT
jgi:methyl-accepting chemotaxis protein